MKTTEDLNSCLFQKIENEQEKFKKKLMTLTPEEVLDHAYEYVTREDIVCCLNENDLTPKQIKTLLKLKKPVAAIYDKWLDTEGSHMDAIRETIEATADDLIRMKKRDQPEFIR